MIHQYKSNGYNIVLDVNSGSVHIVDDTAYDLIPIVEASLRDQVTEISEIARRAERETDYTPEECQ